MGHPRLTAQSPAPHHSSAESIGAIQQPLGLPDSSRRQGTADAAAADPLGAVPEHGQHRHLNAMRAGNPGQIVGIAAAIRSETEVVPYGDAACDSSWLTSTCRQNPPG